MKKIAVGKHFALVDDEDFEVLSQFTWRLTRKGYATRHLPRDGGPQKSMLMHRQIMGLNKGDRVEVDHRNGNKLDNRRNNIRVATPSQNMANVSLRSDNTSGCKGVHWYKAGKKWKAYISYNKKQKHLGTFDTKELAIEFRQLAAELLHGEYVNHG